MSTTDTTPMSPETLRLGHLYALLGGIPAERFDLRYWRAKVDEDMDITRINKISNSEMLNECSTNACAVGWACAYPPFIKQGLGFKRIGRERGPTFNGAKNFTAVALFFGITFEEARRLFLDDFYTPAERQGAKSRVAVMRRIRDMLLGKGAITTERWRVLSAHEEVLLETGVWPEQREEAVCPA